MFKEGVIIILMDFLIMKNGFFLWIFGIVLKKMIKFDSYEIIIELFCGNVFYEKLKILMIGKFLVDDYC